MIINKKKEFLLSCSTAELNFETLLFALLFTTCKVLLNLYNPSDLREMAVWFRAIVQSKMKLIILTLSPPFIPNRSSTSRSHNLFLSVPFLIFHQPLCSLMVKYTFLNKHFFAQIAFTLEDLALLETNALMD